MWSDNNFVDVCLYVLHLKPTFIRFDAADRNLAAAATVADTWRVIASSSTVLAVAAAISDSAHHVYSYFTIHFPLTYVPIASECLPHTQALATEWIPIQKQHLVPTTTKRKINKLSFWSTRRILIYEKNVIRINESDYL